MNVTPEQAKQLKALGYPGLCRNVYQFDGSQMNFIADYYDSHPRDYNKSDVFGAYIYSAPSIDHAHRWLLDKFGLFVRVDYEEKDEWFYHLCYYPGHGFEDYDGKLYPSYNEALSAGISAALQSLI